jgi:uncharacterized membrane protein
MKLVKDVLGLGLILGIIGGVIWLVGYSRFWMLFVLILIGIAILTLWQYFTSPDAPAPRDDFYDNDPNVG